MPEFVEATESTLNLAEPLVIRGGCADWPGSSRLTFDFLRELAGSDEVIVARTHHPSEKKSLTMRDFLDYSESADEADPYYLSDWHYDERYPEIREWMAPPREFATWLDAVPRENRPKWSWLYIGPKNSGSQLHVDVNMTSAWNAVISGCKEWIAFPPDHAISQDLRQGREVAQPAAYDPSEAWTVSQGAGDLIYVPGAWAHAVHNSQSGIAFTENFVNESNYADVAKYLEETGDEKFRRILRGLRIVKTFQ